MRLIGVVLGNVGIFLLMSLFALTWNTIAWLRKRRRASRVTYAYRPSRREWGSYYWRRVRGYLISYGFVLAAVLLVPLLLGRRGGMRLQLLSFFSILPGLSLYFVMASLVPPKYAFHPEGFSAFAVIPFLPGRRDRERGIYGDFRVGLRLWRQYHDAVPRGDVLVLKGEIMGAEILIPRGQRDRLLTLARSGLKKVREERRQVKRRLHVER